MNKTGLDGKWDFTIKWTARGQLARAGADGISIFDAVDKQLGLKLEAGKIPQPVIFVESVNEAPTPNAADISKFLPPPPVPEFDVALIKSREPLQVSAPARVTDLIVAISLRAQITDDAADGGPGEMDKRGDFLAVPA